jgi:hypothetical protein
MTMPITYVYGDLFESVKKVSKNTDVVIPHVVNNKGAFGAGFVVPLANHYREAKASYLAWYELGLAKLGSMYPVPIANTGNITVCHMCAQTLGGERPLYYNMLTRCMDKVGEYAKEHRAIIAAPAFGSGLAGGNWNFIHQLIYDCWVRQYGLDVSIYYIDKNFMNFLKST